jgi:hypothetical protein
MSRSLRKTQWGWAWEINQENWAKTITLEKWLIVTIN